MNRGGRSRPLDSMELAIDSVDEMAGDLEGLAGNSVDDIIDYLREAIACLNEVCVGVMPGAHAIHDSF